MCHYPHPPQCSGSNIHVQFHLHFLRRPLIHSRLVRIIWYAQILISLCGYILDQTQLFPHCEEVLLPRSKSKSYHQTMHNVLRRFTAFPRSFRYYFESVLLRKLDLQLQNSFQNLVMILSAESTTILPYTMEVQLAIIKVSYRRDLIIVAIQCNRLHLSRVSSVNHLWIEELVRLWTALFLWSFYLLLLLCML